MVAGDDWHPGVVGIVASRLVERFRRPAVVIALDGASGRGSGRSIAPYDLHAGLGASRQHLTRFGGHRMAAGLEIEAARVGDFRAALAAHAGAALTPQDLVRAERIDAVVPGGALTLELAEELERLGPFGSANPAPRLLVPAAGIEHVTAMGEERKHARFSLVGGGARARGVAFRRSQRSLAAAGACPQDVAVSLERNRWNGAVEARVVLRALSPTAAGAVNDVGESDLWDAVAHELDCDPALWWPQAGGAPRATRVVRERHGEGLAGLAGDLLTSGAPVLLVVSDVDRRRAGLERTIAAMAPAALAVASWESLARRPELAQPFAHLLAMDPPPVPAGVDLLASAPGEGFAELAWGPAETEFTLGLLAPRLGVRDESGGPVALAQRPAAAWTVQELERGPARTRRASARPALAGRMLRVLAETGLVEVDADARAVLVVSTARTSLERSAAFRAYGERLDAVERHLGAVTARAA